MTAATIDPVLIGFFNRIYPLPDEVLLQLQGCFRPQAIDKKGLILKEGDSPDVLFFIKSGIYRGYYNKDVTEVTAHFYFGPTVFADIVSINEKSRTRLNIQALEEGEVWYANMGEVNRLGERHPELLRFFLRFYEIIYSFGQKRQLSFIFDSAEERYRNLFNERPKVIENIPLAYIASYLGIQPESLSRIRKKMVKPDSAKAPINPDS